MTHRWMPGCALALAAASPAGCSGDANSASTPRSDATPDVVCARCEADGSPTSIDAAGEADAAGSGPNDAAAPRSDASIPGAPDARADAAASDAGAPEAATTADSGLNGPCTDCDETCEEVFPISTAVHLEGDLEYPSLPPAGGSHNGCWAPWGEHAVQIRPENWVHNLEHGGIILLYNCDGGCPDEIAALTDFSASHAHTLLTPYSELPGRFAVVSWGYRLVSECLDMAAIGAFYAAHVDRAPESITADPPAACR